MGVVAIAHTALISTLFLKPFPSLWNMPDLVQVELLSIEERDQREVADTLTRNSSAKEVREKRAVKQNDGGRVMLPAARYYETRELTQKPLVKVDVPTEMMLKLDEEAPQVVIAHLWIGEYGDVDRVDIERNDMLSEKGKEKLQQVFSMARFHPGEIDGVPVRTHMRIAVRLDRPDPQIQGEKRGTE